MCNCGLVGKSNTTPEATPTETLGLTAPVSVAGLGEAAFFLVGATPKPLEPGCPGMAASVVIHWRMCK